MVKLGLSRRDWLRMGLAGTCGTVAAWSALRKQADADEVRTGVLANASRDYAFRIMDPAAVPEEPARPNVKLLLAAAGLLGVLLGVWAGIVAAASRRY